MKTRNKIAKKSNELNKKAKIMFKSLLSSSSRFNLRQSVLKLSQKLGSREFSEETAKFASSEIKSVQNDLFYLVDYWKSNEQGIPPEKVIRDFEVYLFSNRYSEAIKQVLGISVGCLPDKQLEKFSNLLNYFHRTITDCDDDKEKKKIILEFIKSIFSVFKFSQSLDGRSFKFQEKLKKQQQKYWGESFEEELNKTIKKSNIKAFSNDEDNEFYEGELYRDKDDNCPDNFGFGKSGYPIDSEAFRIAIYVRILSRDMVSIQEERNRISAATRYAAHLIELFAKESFYEKNIYFEKNKFLDFLIDLRKQTTNLVSLKNFVNENINDCSELFHIGKAAFDERGYQTHYESNDAFLENIDYEEIISMVSNAWEDSLDPKSMKRVRKLAIKIPELFFEKKEAKNTEVSNEKSQNDSEYPVTQDAFKKALSTKFMRKQMVLRWQKKEMNYSTRIVICHLINKSDPDLFDSYTADEFLSHLILLKKYTSNKKSLKKWITDQEKEWEKLIDLKEIDEPNGDLKESFDLAEIISLVEESWSDSISEKNMKEINEDYRELMENLNKNS